MCAISYLLLTIVIPYTLSIEGEKRYEEMLTEHLYEQVNIESSNVEGRNFGIIIK